MKTPTDIKKINSIRKYFEGKEALYIEKGVWIVRIYDIEIDIDSSMFSATVTEIPTPGFGRIEKSETQEAESWCLGIGDEHTSFSEAYLSQGYPFVVELLFDPEIIKEAKEIVQNLNLVDDPKRSFKTYQTIIHWLQQGEREEYWWQLIRNSKSMF